MEIIHKIRRRKTAVARIYLKEGSGVITVNKRNLTDYFTTPTLQYKVKQAALPPESVNYIRHRIAECTGLHKCISNFLT